MSVASLPAPRDPSPPPAFRKVRLRDLYGALLSDSRCPATLASRKFDVRLLARFLKVPDEDPSRACALFAGSGRGTANGILMAIKEHELARGMAGASVNRLLSTMKRIVAVARKLDLVDYCVEVDGLPGGPVSDTRGPDPAEVEALWATAAAFETAHGLRDLAVISLLYGLALRVGEAVGLDVGDVDLGRNAVAIRGKGMGGAIAWLSLNAVARGALADWIALRGTAPGPLFTQLYGNHGAAPGSIRPPHARISIKAVNRCLRDLSLLAGIDPVRPHGLRHAAVTRALDLTNGDVRKVARFARHKKIETTLRYDDARIDMAGAVGRLLGGDPGRPADAPAGPRPQPRPRPSCRTKLDPATVAEARRLRGEGMTIAALARKFAVHHNTMKSALLGRTWYHVPPAGPSESAVMGDGSDVEGARDA